MTDETRLSSSGRAAVSKTADGGSIPSGCAIETAVGLYRNFVRANGRTPTHLLVPYVIEMALRDAVNTSQMLAYGYRFIHPDGIFRVLNMIVIGTYTVTAPVCLWDGTK